MSSNLKSKKLIILISVLVAVVAIIVILASVFSVRKVSPIFHNFDGSETVPPAEGAPTADDVLSLCGGKSMFFMSKDWLLSELNAKFPEWHARDIVKDFPDIINVHFVKREVAVKIDVSGSTVYVDTYGYVMTSQTDASCVDISSMFEHRDVSVNEAGKPLKFIDEINNQRLSVALDAIMATWRCKVELSNMPVVLGEENVFTFDDNGNLIINTASKAKIKVEEPSENLTERLFAAYSVYYNEKLNLQQSGVEITVAKDGRIITPNPNTDK